MFFYGHWLEAGEYFQGQSFTRYLGLALVFAWGGALWEGFDFCFSEAFQGFFFRGIGKILIFLFGGGRDWAPGYHSMGIRHFPDVS